MRWKTGLISALKWAGKFALAIVLLLLLAEGSLRVAYAVRAAKMAERPQPYLFGHTYTAFPPWVDSTRMIEFDSELIWRMRPEIDFLFVDAFSPAPSNEAWLKFARTFIPELPDWMSGNATWRVRLNSEGFRTEEFDGAPPDDTFRVVCLGDSWTFGSNLGEESAFAHQLEQRLATRFPAIEADVVNMGVPGHSSHQGRILMERTVLGLAPDVVVIGYGGVDGHLGSWQDSAAQERMSKWTGVLSVVTSIELPRLVNYVGKRLQKDDVLLGDRIRTTARLAASNRAKEADALIATKVRVPPEEFEQNVRTIIRLAREIDAEAVLLFNDLEGRVGLADTLEALYFGVLQRIAETEGVPLVDGRTIIGDARRTQQRAMEERFGLLRAGPAAALDAESEAEADAADVGDAAGTTEVLFRVFARERPVPDAMYIAGSLPELADARPNTVAMHDDGTHGDERAGDGVWSLAVELPRGVDILYAYTNSGSPGRWENMDVPHIREVLIALEDAPARLVRPIETFGTVYVQSDSWHPDHYGHGLIAGQLFDAITGMPAMEARLSERRDSAPR